MGMKDTLLTIWLACGEDFDKSLEWLKEKKPVSEELVERTLAGVDRDAYATCLDDDYPEELKRSGKPPLAVKRA